MFRARTKPLVALVAAAATSVGVAAPSAASFDATARAATTTAAAAAIPTPWTQWEPSAKSKPYTLAGCATRITFSEALNKAEERTRTDRDGNFWLQFRGRLHVRINPQRGHTVVADITGPATLVIYPHQDSYFRNRGLNLLTSTKRMYQASNPTRVPRLALTQGTYADFYDGNGTAKLGDDLITILNQPDRYWNVCSVIKTGVVPEPFRV